MPRVQLYIPKTGSSQQDRAAHSLPEPAHPRTCMIKWAHHLIYGAHWVNYSDSMHRATGLPQRKKIFGMDMLIKYLLNQLQHATQCYRKYFLLFTLSNGNFSLTIRFYIT